VSLHRRSYVLKLEKAPMEQNVLFLSFGKKLALEISVGCLYFLDVCSSSRV
jgi:hypothetical protein